MNERKVFVGCHLSGHCQDTLRTQAPCEMGKTYISTATHCILAKFAGNYVCIKRKLPTRLHAISITITMTTRKS